jgi:hypothetical protein
MPLRLAFAPTPFSGEPEIPDTRIVAKTTDHAGGLGALTA